MIKRFGGDEYVNCEPEDLIPRPGALTDQPDANKGGTAAVGKTSGGGAKDAAASQSKKPEQKGEKKKDD